MVGNGLRPIVNPRDVEKMKHVLILFLTLFVIGGCLFALNTCNRHATTVADRKINENSFQYQEARKTELLEFESQLRTLNSQLENLELTPEKRKMLEVQKSNIQERIDVTKGKIK